jgi:hypothetical protein
MVVWPREEREEREESRASGCGFGSTGIQLTTHAALKLTIERLNARDETHLMIGSHCGDEVARFERCVTLLLELRRRVQLGLAHVCHCTASSVTGTRARQRLQHTLLGWLLAGEALVARRAASRTLGRERTIYSVILILHSYVVRREHLSKQPPPGRCILSKVYPRLVNGLCSQKRTHERPTVPPMALGRSWVPKHPLGFALADRVRVSMRHVALPA